MGKKRQNLYYRQKNIVKAITFRGDSGGRTIRKGLKMTMINMLK